MDKATQDGMHLESNLSVHLVDRLARGPASPNSDSSFAIEASIEFESAQLSFAIAPLAAADHPFGFNIAQMEAPTP